MDPTLHSQAVRLERTLPAIMRQISALAPAGPCMELPLAQLRACRLLLDGPRTVSCLGRELGISLSATTQLADRLERTGLVTRQPGGEDRRTKLLSLTADGREQMEMRRRQRLERSGALLAQLPEEDRGAVIAALEALAVAASMLVRSQAEEALTP